MHNFGHSLLVRRAKNRIKLSKVSKFDVKGVKMSQVAPKRDLTKISHLSRPAHKIFPVVLERLNAPDRWYS